MLRGYAKTADVIKKFARELAGNDAESGDGDVEGELADDEIVLGSRNMVHIPTKGS